MNAADKNAAISAAIIHAMSQGMTLEQAIDHVLGSGAFDDIAGKLYDMLRAKAAR